MKRRIPVWQFYYGVDSAGQQSKFKVFSAQGYRMISLNVYGSPNYARYAAVWVQRPGPQYQTIHGVDGARFQAWFSKYAAQGIVSTLVTATGPADSAIYAGVMEKITVASCFQKLGLTCSDFESTNKNAVQNKQILKSFRQYGTPTDPRYCGIWHANPYYHESTLYTGPSGSDYKVVFYSETTKRHWYPTTLSKSDDISYSALFTDTSIGSWLARYGLTGTELQTEYENQKAAGRYIINLAAGGSGSNTRFAALFSD